jgi:GH35 family endo-1,4-beta-xylanase
MIALWMCALLPAASAEDAWRAAARQRIESFRKGDLRVRVKDAREHPVAGAPIHVTMKRHAFSWGACVTAAHLAGQDADDLAYRTRLMELFNCAVFENDLKWNAWHGAWGSHYTREQTQAALDWLKAQAFRIRGHCLVHPGWDYCLPDAGTLRDDPPALQQRILDHIDELAAFTKEYTAEWDVVNEPVHHNEVIAALGQGAMTEWFFRARAKLPASCRLFINDYNIVETAGAPNAREQEDYERLIQALRDAKAPLEGIGFQSHFGDTAISTEAAWRVFDRFARFGLPIEVTEFDVNTKNETAQAAFTRDFMTAAFSHPACCGFVFWGFWEASHWRPDGAMFRKDWSEKPNLEAYRSLVLREWWTDVQGVTDSQGLFSVRGFKGEYQLVAGDKEVKAAIGDAPLCVEVTL